MNSKQLKEIIRIYIIDGMSNKEIADTLGISIRTVYRYTKRIREEPKVSFENYKTEVKDIMKMLGYETEKRMNKKQEIKLKFISSPVYGYLLVPSKIMDKYPKIKKEISKLSWIADNTWYLEESDDTSLFVDYVDVKYKDVEFITTEDDISLYVMSPHNPSWRVFCNILCIRLDSRPCDAKTLTQTTFILDEFFPEIDVERSVEYFESHGGFCDCEVLMMLKIVQIM